MKQSKLSDANHEAWETMAYEAWVKEWGSPTEAAAQLVDDPDHKVRRFLPHLPDIKGKRIANPLGSNGRLAIAFALLGADVTVFDISTSNRRFALEVAHHAGVKINFVVGDFLAISLNDYRNTFDITVLELGILHYFSDLTSLLGVLHSILKQNGFLVINEFHPLLKKAIAVEDGEARLTGNYFATSPENADVAYQSILNDDSLPKCLVRRWTLGEIVTAFAKSRFQIELLEELPDWNCDRLPGMFTLVLRKSNAQQTDAPDA